MTESIDRRVITDIETQVIVVINGIDSLLKAEQYRSQLIDSQYADFAESLKVMTDATQALVGLLKNPTSRIAHDANNKIGIIYGKAQLLEKNELYRTQLSPAEYTAFIKQLKTIETATLKITDLFQSLGGFYKAKEQGVGVVDASTLGKEETVYRIVHVDDSELERMLMRDSLKRSSNVVNPYTHGVFGHDGKKVRYEVHSYSSVDEALREIPSLEPIHLLITDREMPERDGYNLLDTISLPNEKRTRKPEYQRFRNIAMLTGGITEEEAARVSQTYGATVLTKPVKPLVLEQQIYKIITKGGC